MVNGVDIFHYAAHDFDDSDFVLTSGFFSALQSFSQEVRSAKIDFFASETEIFMFDDFKEKENATIVVVFDNDIQQSVAREVLKQVKNTIIDSELFNLPESTTLSLNEEKALRARIRDVSLSLISIDFQIKASKELISSNPDISAVLMYNYYNDELYHSYVDDNTSFNEEKQLRALRSISRYIIPLVKEYNVGTNFDLLTIETYDVIMIISKQSTDYTIIISKDPDNPSVIYDLPFKMMSQPGFDFYYSNFKKYNSNTEYRINDAGKVQYSSGVSWSHHDIDIIVKTIGALNRLLDAFELDQFHEINIYPEEQDMGYIRFTRNFTRQLNNIEFFR